MSEFATVLNDGEIYLRLDRTVGRDDDTGRVPAFIFTVCRCSDDEEVGGCDLRVGHSGRDAYYSTYYGGNIGYHIDASFRGNRYAAKACLLLFRLAKEKGMGRVYITCDPSNPASKRTCELAGCEFVERTDIPSDNSMYKEGKREVLVFLKRL